MWILGHEGLSMKATTKISSYCKSSTKPRLSNKPPPSNKPPFSGALSIKPPSPPLPSPNYSSLIDDGLYQSITTVKLCVD